MKEEDVKTYPVREYPGANDQYNASTKRPERRKKPLDAHGIGPSSARNTKLGNFSHRPWDL